MRCYVILVLIVVFAWNVRGEVPVREFDQALFDERKKALAFVEYFVQREVDRQSGESIGLVVDDSGTIVCLPSSFSDWIPPDRFRNIRVFPADNAASKGFSAKYLGEDKVNNWHYLRMEDEAAMEHFTPITDFESADISLGEPLWGIGMTTGELDYFPYFRDARVSTRQKLPLWTGFTTEPVTVPGGPVFNFDGDLVGWGRHPFPVERDMWIGSDYYRISIRNPDETSAFIESGEFLEFLGKGIPEKPTGQTRAWLGVSGTQPIDSDTAEFMGLEDQGALVISEVIPESPASQSGLENRDIIVSLDEDPLPRLKPDSVLQRYFERYLLMRSPGDSIQLDIIRGNENLTLTAELGKAPPQVKEAERHYFKTPGFTIREFLMSDAIKRRVDHREAEGIVVSFVRDNSPAEAGELQPGDWIQKIEGESVPDFEEAKSKLESLVSREPEEEIVLLVKRGNETAVIRIKPENGG